MSISVTTYDDGRVEVVDLNAYPTSVIDLNPGPISFVELQQGPTGEQGLQGIPGPIGDLTGAVTTNGTASSLGSFTIADLNTAISDADVSIDTHLHSGVYEPADATILKDADIGVTIAASLGVDDNYVTDAEKTKLFNLSGINTGDNAANTTSNTYADGKVADSITNGVTTIAPSQNAVFDALTGKQDAGSYVTSVSATSPIASSGGTTPTISIPAATNLVDGYATSSHIAAIEANTAKVSNETHSGDATGATALTVVAINGTNLAALGTGILKNTTGTGVPGIAIAADFPTLNQNTTGNAATVTTNANLTGHITSIGNASSLGSFTISDLNTAISDANVPSIAGDIGGSAASPAILQVHKFSKTFTYNGSGQLTGLSDANGTKTFVYTDGALTSVTGTGIYQSGTLTYTDGVLTSTTF